MALPHYPRKLKPFQISPDPKQFKINFFRRFLPQAAQKQLPLQKMLGKCEKRDKTPLNWTDESDQAFQNCIIDLKEATHLAHPDSNAAIILMTDASDRAIGGCMQQREGDSWKPLGFFSRKLSTAEQKYSAYDRELLAIFASIKYFRYLLEGTKFTILTDHKPITYAFSQKIEKLSPRQINHLNFIAQFTVDIKHISGKDNVVADALSRIESICIYPLTSFGQSLQAILSHHFPILDSIQTCTNFGNNTFQKITFLELKFVLNEISPNKAPGPDGLKHGVIKQMINTDSEWFLQIFNNCLLKGIFPKCWKSTRLPLSPRRERIYLSPLSIDRYVCSLRGGRFLIKSLPNDCLMSSKEVENYTKVNLALGNRRLHYWLWINF
ncbi:Transposon Tf2-11 polyprotein [Araneus ventricosus]|uniref:Transposon Tf2-11 polyprotein n=1 Tax=Araneus ventricosus TaxID=182803 RepID=A0A4Y2FD01_ARAVE|nr:Transposon Tf2-11 polyprotein [Araneus ventricosus]